MVQVTKDPMGGKGARLTAQISMPGRFLVLAPNQDVSGISRRLPEDERKRLKAILKKVRPEEHGVIVRTAAEGATEEAFVAPTSSDSCATWDDIQKKAKKAKAPAELYEEPELTVRVVRDLFTDEEFQRARHGLAARLRQGDGVRRDVAPDLEPKVHAAQGQAPGVRGAPRRRADPQGARPEGVAALGRLPVHRAHRGHDDRRRQHRQERRQDQPRGDGRRTRTSRPPARSPGSSGCATSAGSS